MRYNEGAMNKHNESITSSHQKGKIDLSRLEPKPSFTIQGGLLRGYMPGLPPRTEHTRGKICGESRRSRKRLMDKLATVDLAHYAAGILMLTLTFPDPLPSMMEMKAMLEKYGFWIRRRFEGIPVLWRYELGEKTERPHFHLIIFCEKFMRVEQYSKAWGRLGGGYVHIIHLPSETAQRYVSKYVSKAAGNRKDWGKAPEDTPAGERASMGGGADGAVHWNTSHISVSEENEPLTDLWTGRTWGFWNEDHLKRKEPIRVDFENTADYEKFQARLKRIIRGWMKAERKRTIMYGYGKSAVPVKVTMSLEKELYKAWRLYRTQGKMPCYVKVGTLWKMFGPKHDGFLKHKGSWSCYVPQSDSFQNALWDCVVLLNHEVYQENHYERKNRSSMEKKRIAG